MSNIINEQDATSETIIADIKPGMTESESSDAENEDSKSAQCLIIK